LIHSEQIKKDLIEIVLKSTEIVMFLCTVYERRPLTQYYVLLACCSAAACNAARLQWKPPITAVFDFYLKKLQKLSR